MSGHSARPPVCCGECVRNKCARKLGTSRAARPQACHLAEQMKRLLSRAPCSTAEECAVAATQRCICKTSHQTAANLHARHRERWLCHRDNVSAFVTQSHCLCLSRADIYEAAGCNGTLLHFFDLRIIRSGFSPEWVESVVAAIAADIQQGI